MYIYSVTLPPTKNWKSNITLSRSDVEFKPWLSQNQNQKSSIFYESVYKYYFDGCRTF